jgi:hypothetical protein
LEYLDAAKGHRLRLRRDRTETVRTAADVWTGMCRLVASGVSLTNITVVVLEPCREVGERLGA